MMNTNNTTTREFKLYVADLADYNAGLLSGFWLDIEDLTANEISEKIQDFLKKRTEETSELHEEYAIHDMEGFPSTLTSEWPDFKELVEYMELIQAHGDAYEAYCEWIGFEYATPEGFEESYCGEYDSEQDYAEELADEIMEIPTNMEPYFDYEKFSNELFMTDYHYEAGYVFRNC